MRPDRESSFNAVIYQVDEVELRATDQREVSYCRESVPASDISPLETDCGPARELAHYFARIQLEGGAYRK